MALFLCRVSAAPGLLGEHWGMNVHTCDYTNVGGESQLRRQMRKCETRPQKEVCLSGNRRGTGPYPSRMPTSRLLLLLMQMTTCVKPGEIEMLANNAGPTIIISLPIELAWPGERPIG